MWQWQPHRQRSDSGICSNFNICSNVDMVIAIGRKVAFAATSGSNIDTFHVSKSDSGNLINIGQTVASAQTLPPSTCRDPTVATSSTEVGQWYLQQHQLKHRHLLHLRLHWNQQLSRMGISIHIAARIYKFIITKYLGNSTRIFFFTKLFVIMINT